MEDPSESDEEESWLFLRLPDRELLPLLTLLSFLLTNFDTMLLTLWVPRLDQQPICVRAMICPGRVEPRGKCQGQDAELH